MIVICDAALQEGPTDLIKCPYEILKQRIKDKIFVDLTEDHKDNIQAIVQRCIKSWFVKHHHDCC